MTRCARCCRKNRCIAKPNSPGETLAVILRFLATGDSVQATSFEHRLGHTALSRIPAACNACTKIT